MVEGEKDADRLAGLFMVATCNFEGAAKGSQKAKWRPSYTAALAGADLILIPDNDEPGRAHMRHVAESLAGSARVRWLDLPDLPEKGDVSDWLNQGHTIDELQALIANATAPDQGGAGASIPPQDNGGADDDTAEIARLAALSLMEYDRQRTAAAKALSIRGDTLDKLVKAARGEPDKAGNGGGTALEFPDVEPWPYPVNGAELLNELTASVKRFMSLPDHAAAALALWTVNSYIVVKHGHVAPILAVTSPEKRCGKSTLLGWLYRLVDKPLLAANITAAAIFRTVDAYHPTLLIDEADSFLGETGDELRGILNSGHTRDTAYVIRVSGEELEPRCFSTWGTKAVALIGKLEGRYSTLADRSIEIQLRRKLPAEKLVKLRHAGESHFEDLARRCARLAADYGARLGKARPDIPDSLNDRAQDNWEPLLAIADTAGGHWPRLARTVAMALSGGADSSGSEGIGVQLLSDLRRYFNSGHAVSYPTTALLQHLNEIDDAPWSAYSKGKPITARHLARILHPYGILPHPIRLGSTVAKGYEVTDFADAFGRYLPCNGYTVTSQSKTSESPYSVSVTNPSCNRYEDASLASPQAGCNPVTEKTADTAAGGDDANADDVAYF
jgi:putative DNA primase/helicase